MSLKNVLTCYERISYTASPAITSPDGGAAAAKTTEMTTVAEITTHGKLRHGGVAAKSLGKRMEQYSMDRWGRAFLQLLGL